MSNSVKLSNFIRFHSYSPQNHIHVICPKSKQNCFAGIGVCVNNDVVMTIFNSRFNIRDSLKKKLWSKAVRITFNKGCSCQMHSRYGHIGDGN